MDQLTTEELERVVAAKKDAVLRAKLLAEYAALDGVQQGPQPIAGGPQAEEGKVKGKGRKNRALSTVGCHILCCFCWRFILLTTPQVQTLSTRDSHYAKLIHLQEQQDMLSIAMRMVAFVLPSVSRWVLECIGVSAWLEGYAWYPGAAVTAYNFKAMLKNASNVRF